MFNLKSKFKTAGDQPVAIKKLAKELKDGHCFALRVARQALKL